MILSKAINDIDEDEYKQNVGNCDASDANTERTSLGGSVRCGYKSYSEKFLAEQEAAKQNTLLQLTNGVDVDGAGHLLQLTNGEALSAVDEASLEASNPSLGSDRKGVYGGGVRYFTKDSSMYEESEAQSSDEDRFEDDDDDDGEEEEEEESDEEVEEEEEESGMYEEYAEEDEEEEEEQEEMYEVEGSMGSMFSNEDTSFIDQRSAGVDSFSASSTISSGYPAPLQREQTYREEAPQDGMVRSKF
jgi:cobalamin biosynthesis protein CobT